MIGKTNIKLLIDQAKNLDFIIVPSKGGGTNALIIKPLSIDMKFGGFSFKKHIEEAEKKKRQKEKARKEAIEKRTERTRKKYSR